MKAFILSILIAIFLASCSPKVYQSAWQTRPVVADGNAGEWELPLRFYDKNSTLQYTVSNDSANIYFCLRAVDRALQFRIKHAGMQIWFDTTGNANRQIGFIFPFVDKNNPLFKSDIVGPGGPVPDFIKYEKKRMKIAGNDPLKDEVIEFPNKYGISAYMDVDEFGVLVYECAIPISFVADKLSIKTLGITLYSEAFNLSDGEDRMSRRSMNDTGDDFSMGNSQMRMPGQPMGGGMGGGMPQGPVNGGFQPHDMQQPGDRNEKLSFNKPIEIQLKLQIFAN